jgi:hypothetical protein
MSRPASSREMRRVLIQLFVSEVEAIFTRAQESAIFRPKMQENFSAQVLPAEFIISCHPRRLPHVLNVTGRP